MIQGIFESLSHATQAAPLVAIMAAAAWGVLSVVLSPCHLSSIPLIVGYLGGQADLTPRRALGLATVFALGILATIAVIAIITTALGRMAGDIGPWGNYLVAAIFLVVGLYLLGVIPLPSWGGGARGVGRTGLAGALLLGLIFGFALGPCTFAYMAPLLAVAFRAAGEAPWYAASLFAAYALGHCLVLAAAGASTGLVQQYLKWHESSRAAAVLKGVCGLLVIAGGLYLIYTAA